MTRSSLLSLVLLVGVIFVGQQTYRLWRTSTLRLPERALEKYSSPLEESVEGAPPRSPVTPRNIVERNLFDPERGAGETKEAEASSGAAQRLRSMVLLGTAVFGDSRYAILRGPVDARPAGSRNPAPQASAVRLKQGDSVEGFTLSEIHEKRVVFTRGASRVEIPLDYFRRIEDVPEKAKTPPRPLPGIGPRLRRPLVRPGPAAPEND